MLTKWEQEQLAEIEAGLVADHGGLRDARRRRRRLAALAAAVWTAALVVCVVLAVWPAVFGIGWLSAMMGGAWLVSRGPGASTRPVVAPAVARRGRDSGHFWRRRHRAR